MKNNFLKRLILRTALTSIATLSVISFASAADITVSDTVTHSVSGSMETGDTLRFTNNLYDTFTLDGDSNNASQAMDFDVEFGNSFTVTPTINIGGNIESGSYSMNSAPDDKSINLHFLTNNTLVLNSSDININNVSTDTNINSIINVASTLNIKSFLGETINFTELQLTEGASGNHTVVRFDAGNNAINANIGTVYLNNHTLLDFDTAENNDISFTGNIFVPTDGDTDIAVQVIGDGKLHLSGNLGTEAAPISSFIVGEDSISLSLRAVNKATIMPHNTLYVKDMSMTSLDTTLDLSHDGGQTLNVSGDFTHTKDGSIIKLANNSKIAGTGQWKVGNTVHLDAEDLTQSIDLSEIYTGTDDSKLVLSTQSSSSIVDHAISVTQVGDTSNYKVSLTSSLTANTADTVKTNLANVNLSTGVSNFVNTILDSTADGQEGGIVALVQALNTAAKNGNSSTFNNLLPKDTRNSSHQVSDTINVAANSISDIALSKSLGVASSHDLREGSISLWMKTIMGIGSQSSNANSSNSAPVFDSMLHGGVFGMEYNTASNVKLGALVSVLQNHINYKDSDSLTQRSLIGGAYASYLSQESKFFVSGNINLAHSNTDNGNVTNYIGYGMVGYKVANENSDISAMPLIGLRISKDKYPTQQILGGIAQWAETDTTNTDISIGASIAQKYSEDLFFIPEIHGFMYYNIKGYDDANSMTINGTNSDISYVPDNTRVRWNIGTALTRKSDIAEYSFALDSNFAKGYFGLQGGIKIKVSI